jgi:acyl-CoA thioester hydrolase
MRRPIADPDEAPMNSRFTMRRRVAFSETDAAGIVHFSHFFRYMEDAEHAFIRSLGHSVATRIGNERYGWPRVRAECEYLSPLKFEDELEVTLLVKQVKPRAITYDFFLHHIEEGRPDKLAARGSITAVCVQRQADGTMASVPIPMQIAGLIAPASPEDHPPLQGN